MTKPKNILIVRTDRIGDVVLSLPLTGLIKKHCPNCKVSLLLRDYTKEIAEDHPHIDEVLILKEENGKIPVNSNVELLKEKSFDSCIVVYPTLITALIVFLSRIKIRVGSGYRWYSFLFNRRVYEHRKYAEKHELEFNVSLLKVFGINEVVTPNNVVFDIKINPSSLERVKETLNSFGINLNTKLIIAHPGSGGSAVDLPLEKFAKVVSSLNDIEELTVIITGSEDEKKICEFVSGDTNVINLAGKFNLSELAALISFCSVFISNSTGPIHIAAALGIFTIGFYPKILACSQERWGPYTKNKAVFLPEIDCEDCTREQCEQLDCMNSINYEGVIREVEKEISK
ncbi:MAG: glycosyltransferase family 9 protein [Ignavibacterium sp.]|nr:MAG: glycosyltransferase family 9 protein [Ignavibacterium sp.]